MAVVSQPNQHHQPCIKHNQGPFLTTRYFLPNLEQSENGRIVNISSAFGSVTGKRNLIPFSYIDKFNNNVPDNKIGTCMAYRVAKTALNQVTMTFARDFEKEGRKVTTVNMEPGFVSTRLTGYDFVDDMDTCIAGLVKGIEAITKEDNGQFISWSGDRLRY